MILSYESLETTPCLKYDIIKYIEHPYITYIVMWYDCLGLWPYVIRWYICLDNGEVGWLYQIWIHSGSHSIPLVFSFHLVYAYKTSQVLWCFIYTLIQTSNYKSFSYHQILSVIRELYLMKSLWKFPNALYSVTMYNVSRKSLFLMYITKIDLIRL